MHSGVTWDPRSYLADAASEHVQSIDAHTAATTIVDYYDYVASHLEDVATSNAIRDASILHKELHPRASPGMEEAPWGFMLKGQAMCVPFTILVASPDTGISQQDWEREMQPVIRAAVEATFVEMHTIFGHHPTSKLRQLDAHHDVTIDDPHLVTVLQCAYKIQQATNGTFTIQGLRLAQLMRNAVRQCSTDDPDGRLDTFTDPSNPASPFYTTYCDVVQDLEPNALIITLPSETDTRGCDSIHVTKRAGMPLDLDALSKGYIIDRLTNTIASYKPRGAMIEWGGDLRIMGKPPLRCQRDDWCIGVVRPPRLDDMYRKWMHHIRHRHTAYGQEGVEVGESVVQFVSEHPPHTTHSNAACEETPQQSFLRAVNLDGEVEGGGCAMATSGDYEQVLRFGFTHIVVGEGVTRTLLRAQAHTVASVSVVARTAMEADAMATAMLASVTPKAALEVLLSCRFRADYGLQRYVLYVRNHNVLLSDDCDEVAGEGDEARLLMVSGEHQRDIALNVVSHVTSAPTPPGPYDGRRRRSHIDDVQSTGTADACHHISALPARNDHTRSLKYLCGSCIPHPTCLLVFPSAAVSGLTGTRREASSRLVAVRVSSIVYCGQGRGHEDAKGSDELWLSMNVMRGTALYNAVIESDRCPLVLHMASSDSSAPHVYRRDPREWLAGGGGGLGTTTVASRDGDIVCTTFTELLMSVASDDRVLTVGLRAVKLETAGDHCVALCCGRELVPTATGNASLHDVYPTCCMLPLPLSPFMVIGRHKQHGTFGIVAFGLRMCSEAPLMISFHAKYSCASRVFVDGSLAGPDLELLVPSQAADWFDGEDASHKESFTFLRRPVNDLRRRAALDDVVSVHCKVLDVVTANSSAMQDGDSRMVVIALVQSVTSSSPLDDAKPPAQRATVWLSSHGAW